MGNEKNIFCLWMDFLPNTILTIEQIEITQSFIEGKIEYFKYDRRNY
jgi:hypothetical protein